MMAAARQALLAHEKNGTATRVKGSRPGIADTWTPAAVPEGPRDEAPPAEALGASKEQAAGAGGRGAWLPPRWFVVLFWHGHRVLVRATRGRLGLWRLKPGGWGALRLTTTGRRTGRPRQVVVGYLDDGRHLVTMGDERVGCGRTRVVAEPAG